MNNKTNKELLRILDAINRLSQQNPNQYVDDFQIADNLSLSIQEVRDYIDLLEQSNLIKTANSAGGHSALLNANGRTFLRDPDYFSNQSDKASVVFSGNFQGAIINFQTELDHVSQIINSAPNFDDNFKSQFQDLIQQLFNELKEAPKDKEDDIEAVLVTAKTLVETMSKEKINKPLVTINADSLKKAAENIAQIMPTVLSVATQIVLMIKNS
jgi:hypothetical protein